MSTTQPPAQASDEPMLLPCPFCGGTVVLEKGTRGSSMGPRDWWGVKCRNTMNRGGTCAIEQIPSGSVEAAVERWNRRAPRATADVERDWISVADCMPPEGEPVLTSGAKRVGMVVMQHTERDDWQIETASEWHSAYPPKFWMHLPPEPEAAK